MKYIASCSFGKDSLATVILARMHGEPLDGIVYSEVMFDRYISGEVPEHRDFIYEVAIPQMERWGYPVKVVRAKTTFLDCFNHILCRGKFRGMKKGFPYFGGCCINRDCKTPPIKAYWRDTGDEVIQYVGISADEKKRLLRLEGTNKVSLLAKYGVTEAEAKELCREEGLLSPIYEWTNRNGCWFCPNANDRELRHLYFEHRPLVDKLIELEHSDNLPPQLAMFNRTGTPTEAFSKFALEEAQVSIFDYVEGL